MNGPALKRPEQTCIVIGGGIAGLAAAYFLKTECPELHLVILEKEAEAGGKLRSTKQDGFTLDWGPNGFLTSAPEAYELALALGLEDELQSAADEAKYRFVYRDGGLRPLPTSPGAFLASELLSPLAKARAAAEVVLGSRTDEEESVYAFLQRHFGTETAHLFAEIAVSGVTAGDPRKLSLDALFPRFRQLEHRHGSLIRGLIQAQKAQRASGARGRLTSFRQGGIGRLVSALTKDLGDRLRRGAEVKALEKSEHGFRLFLSDGAALDAGHVLVATPAYVAGRLLKPLLPQAAHGLNSLPYADVAVLGLGYDRIDIPRPLDGFGFLVPRGEGVKSLGVLWSSSIFPGRAPDGKVLLRVIGGGSLEPGFTAASDGAILEVVRRDLRLSMGVTAEPEFSRLVRWPQGIPQYLLGHTAKVTAIRQALPPGLHLIGNAYDGVGVNDAVRSAKSAAQRILEGSPLYEDDSR